ncbi:MAG: hypothetical protein WAL05_11450 [Candidatus Sulfotelmatobacter sp.]
MLQTRTLSIPPLFTTCIPRTRSQFATFVLWIGVAICWQGCSRRQPAPPDGATLFAQKCASCHRPDNDMRATEPAALREMSKASILAALDTGRMKWEGKFLSKAGSLDGHLRAYDTRSGKVLWDFDTSQEFQTTNGIKAHGGSLNGAGPAIVSGMVYVNTGYTNAMAGNVLLAFSVDSQ